MKASNIVRFTKATCALLLLLCCFAFSPLHHGWSNYDQTKKLNYTGEIIESSYENPHGMMKLKVDDKVWTVVLAPPSRMESRGLTKDMLKKGTTASVLGYPHFKVKDEMRAEWISIDDKKTELR